MLQAISDADFFASQARRLCGLSSFPRYAEGVAELARAIEEASGGSRKFADEIVTAFCDDGGMCPDVRAIKLRAWEMVHPNESSVRTDPVCGQCGGSGWYSETKSKWFNGVETLYDYAAPCACRAGGAR